jgi:CcmD family protein
MDPVLAEIYSTVLQAAPFVIAAYASIWVVLLGYVLLINAKSVKLQRELQLLEERLEGIK